MEDTDGVCSTPDFTGQIIDKLLGETDYMVDEKDREKKTVNCLKAVMYIDLRIKCCKLRNCNPYNNTKWKKMKATISRIRE